MNYMKTKDIVNGGTWLILTRDDVLKRNAVKCLQQKRIAIS